MVMLDCPVAPRKSGQVLFLDVCILGWVVLMNRKVFPGVFCLFFNNIYTVSRSRMRQGCKDYSTHKFSIANL